MFTHTRLALSVSVAALALSGCTQSQQATFSMSCPTPSKISESESSLSGLTLVGRYIADSPFDSSAAEIVDYDDCHDQLLVVNAQSKRVDVLQLDDTQQPSLKTSLDLKAAGELAGIEIGAANSVSTSSGLIAVAIENQIKQQNGIIALYRTDDLSLVTTFPTGALPDMVSFSPNGRYIATANEGEPSSDYSIDPEGSITLVDLQNGVDNAEVTQIGFTEFNRGGARHTELEKHVRISAPTATVAQDLEPEYLTFGKDGYLYVALQENNALAKVNLSQKQVERILPLGEKSWQNVQLDASNKDKIVGNFQQYPSLVGLYMPDSIDSYQVDGKSYILTANEGDGREYGFKTTQQVCEAKGFEWDEDDYSQTEDYANKQGFCIAYSDELRGKKLDVDAAHPLHQALKDNKQLARLKVIAPSQPVQPQESIRSFGTRSFSIWNAEGQRTYDSGDQFANIISSLSPSTLNSSNDSNRSADDRSDDKGVEPEAIEVAKLNGRHYAFIGLERQGGIMVYDVSNPEDAMFLHYSNNRNFAQPVCTQIEDGECANGQYNPQAGDLGPESIHYFSRNGQHLLAVGNEVSGTTSIYRIDF